MELDDSIEVQEELQKINGPFRWARVYALLFVALCAMPVVRSNHFHASDEFELLLSVPAAVLLFLPQSKLWVVQQTIRARAERDEKKKQGSVA